MGRWPCPDASGYTIQRVHVASYHSSLQHQRVNLNWRRFAAAAAFPGDLAILGRQNIRAIVVARTSDWPRMARALQSSPSLEPLEANGSKKVRVLTIGTRSVARSPGQQQLCVESDLDVHWHSAPASGVCAVRPGGVASPDHQFLKKKDVQSFFSILRLDLFSSQLEQELTSRRALTPIQQCPCHSDVSQLGSGAGQSGAQA